MTPLEKLANILEEEIKNPYVTQDKWADGWDDALEWVLENIELIQKGIL